jgi:hypothetical protein
MKTNERVYGDKNQGHPKSQNGVSGITCGTSSVLLAEEGA